MNTSLNAIVLGEFLVRAQVGIVGIVFALAWIIIGVGVWFRRRRR